MAFGFVPKEGQWSLPFAQSRAEKIQYKLQKFGPTRRIMDVGWRGYATAATEGFGAAYGFYRNPATGKMAFMGGGGGGLLKKAGRLFAPAFTGLAIYQGFREGGMAGAAKGAIQSGISWALWDVGLKAAGALFKGTAIARMGATMMGLALPATVIAAAGYAAYKGAEYFAQRGRQAMMSEFVGNMASFQTDAAYTMRQRAMQEISISHTNSRTVLGQEAQLMHLR